MKKFLQKIRLALGVIYDLFNAIMYLIGVAVTLWPFSLPAVAGVLIIIFIPIYGIHMLIKWICSLF